MRPRNIDVRPPDKYVKQGRINAGLVLLRRVRWGCFRWAYLTIHLSWAGCPENLNSDMLLKTDPVHYPIMTKSQTKNHDLSWKGNDSESLLTRRSEEHLRLYFSNLAFLIPVFRQKPLPDSLDLFKANIKCFKWLRGLSSYHWDLTLGTPMKIPFRERFKDKKCLKSYHGQHLYQHRCKSPEHTLFDLF